MATSPTLKTELQGAFTRVVQLLVGVKNDLAGKIGVLTSLNTTNKTSLVNALNELKAAIDGASEISDTTTAATSTWSSSKIQASITASITALVNNAPGASDTLAELANQITALAQADTGLVSAAAVQNLTATQEATARNNIKAASAAEIGDISTMNLTATVNSAYNGS